MATHNFDNGRGVYSSASAATTDDGEILLVLGTYPLSAMCAIPMSVAVNLATDILEQAQAKQYEAAVQIEARDESSRAEVEALGKAALEGVQQLGNAVLLRSFSYWFRMIDTI